MCECVSVLSNLLVLLRYFNVFNIVVACAACNNLNIYHHYTIGATHTACVCVAFHHCSFWHRLFPNTSIYICVHVIVNSVASYSSIFFPWVVAQKLSGVTDVTSLMSASRVAAFSNRRPFNDNRQLVFIFWQKNTSRNADATVFRGNNHAYQFQIHLNSTTRNLFSRCTCVRYCCRDSI